MEALRTQRLVVYLMLVTVGLAASLPVRPAWDATARRWAGAGLVVLGIVILAVPSVPAGSVSPALPVQAFDYLSPHPGRIFTEYTWGDYSIARHRSTFVDGRTDLFEGSVLTQFFAVSDLTTNPDPILSAAHVRYVVWAPGTPLSEYLVTRRALVRRGPHAPGPRLRAALSTSRSPGHGGFEAAEVALFVGPDGGLLEAVGLEHRIEERRLLASELEQERTARSKEAGRLHDDAAEGVGPVGPAVIVRRDLVAQGVPGEESERWRGHVGDDGHHHVDGSVERWRQRVEEVAFERLHTI